MFMYTFSLLTHFSRLF